MGAPWLRAGRLTSWRILRIEDRDVVSRHKAPTAAVVTTAFRHSEREIITLNCRRPRREIAPRIDVNRSVLQFRYL